MKAFRRPVLHCLSLIPNTSLSSPANIFGLFTTTTFITRSSQHLNRNIPSTISKIAITNSITFSEKNEMHITAPKNAAAARHTPLLCPFLGPLRRNIPFTPLSRSFGQYRSAQCCPSAYYSFFLKSVTYFFKKYLFIRKNCVIIEISLYS